MYNLIFEQTTNLNYKLNDVELSKEDLCLLLELFEYNVDRCMPHGQFYWNSRESLLRLDADEFFEVFNAFKTLSPQAKEFYRQMVTNRYLTTEFSSPN